MWSQTEDFNVDKKISTFYKDYTSAILDTGFYITAFYIASFL